MSIVLTSRQKDAQAEFSAFADEVIAPFASQFDREERIPSNLIERLARRGYLGAALPKQVGGLGADMIPFGLLNEELGRACSSVRSLLTVHSMVASTMLRPASPRRG